jgi:2'-5' RNA ligase
LECRFGYQNAEHVAKARLGVALLLPPQVAAEVDGLRRAVGDGSLHRIPAHLTLVPPVNVAEARLPEALAVLRTAAALAGPLTLELGPPRSFLPDSPVLYLAVDGDVAEVHALRGRVLRDPLARTISWPFVPHVTLADSASPEVIEAAVTALSRFRAQVGVDRVHLLRESAGRVWEPIAEALLRPPAVIGRGGIPVELSVTTHLDPEAAGFCQQQGSVAPSFAVTARRDQHVVGVATGTLSDDVAHLEHLLVDAGQRRQGIGSHLLAAVESLAAEKGCRAIVADSGPDAVMETFLRSRGWQPEAGARLRRELTRAK